MLSFLPTTGFDFSRQVLTTPDPALLRRSDEFVHVQGLKFVKNFFFYYFYKRHYFADSFPCNTSVFHHGSKALIELVGSVSLLPCLLKVFLGDGYYCSLKCFRKSPNRQELMFSLWKVLVPNYISLIYVDHSEFSISSWINVGNLVLQRLQNQGSYCKEQQQQR